MYSLYEGFNNKVVTLNEIYSKVSEIELWRYYCQNFEELDKPFISELYNDTNPSCRIRKNKIGKLYYKDFGEGHYFVNIIEYLKAKYGSNFKESIDIIATDFKIRNINIPVNKTIKITQIDEKLLYKPRTDIQILEQPFTLNDYNYWDRFKLSLSFLELNEVLSCKYVFLSNSRGCFRYEYSRNNPIYAYKEYDIDLNFLGYRVYFPYENKLKKWINNSFGHKVIQGIKGLVPNGDLLIITKSLKDVLILRNLGYNAISLSSENTPLSEEIYKALNRRFKRIISLYDTDSTGIKYASLMEEKWGIKAYFIPLKYNVKDLGEFIEKYGLEMTVKLLKTLISE